MPTITLDEISGADDGHITCQGSTWTTAHGGTGTLTVFPGSSDLFSQIGSSLSVDGTYFLERTFISFPPVSLPVGGGITSADLIVRPFTPLLNTPTNSAAIFLWTKAGNPAPLANGSFPLVGAQASSPFLMNDVYASGPAGLTVSLNSSGLGQIKTSGTVPTRFAVRSSNDYTNTPPPAPISQADQLFTLVAPTVPAYQLVITYSLTPPTFDFITPPNGTTTGGLPFTVVGSNFQTGATVTIGGVSATGVSVPSSTSVTGSTGPHPAVGVVDVVVDNPDGGSATGTGAFTYEAGIPTVQSVSPPSGAVEGGTSVTVIGTGFASGGSPANSVTFGGVDAASVVVVSDSVITCVTPPHAAGSVDVVVVNPDSAGSGTLTSGYNYTTTPPIFSGAGSQLFYDFNRRGWFTAAYGSLQMLATDPTSGAPRVYALTADGTLIQAFDESVPAVPADSGNARRGFLQTMPMNLGNMTSRKQFHGFVMVVNDVSAIATSDTVTAPWQAFLFVDNANNSTPPIQVPLIVNPIPYNTMPYGTVEGGNTANNFVGELIGYFQTPAGGVVDGHNAYLEIYYPQGTPVNTPTSGMGPSGPLNLPWSVYRMDIFVSSIDQSKVEP